MRTGFLSPRIKRPGRGVNHKPASSTEVKETVELYLYSPSDPSWPVLGRTFFIFFLGKERRIVMLRAELWTVGLPNKRQEFWPLVARLIIWYGLTKNGLTVPYVWRNQCRYKNKNTKHFMTIRWLQGMLWTLCVNKQVRDALQSSSSTLRLYSATLR
jgi:hypothetical protein